MPGRLRCSVGSPAHLLHRRISSSPTSMPIASAPSRRFRLARIRSGRRRRRTGHHHPRAARSQRTRIRWRAGRGYRPTSCHTGPRTPELLHHERRQTVPVSHACGGVDQPKNVRTKRRRVRPRYRRASRCDRPGWCRSGNRGRTRELAHNTNETNPTGRMDFMSVVPLPLAVGASGNSARQTKLSETVCAKITVMGSGGQGQTLCSARIAPIATGRDDSGGEPAPRETVGLRCLLWAIPRARQPLLAPTPLPIRSRSRRESLRAAIHIEEDLPGSRRRPVVRVFRRIDR